MNQSLLHDENKFDEIVILEDILNTPDDSDKGYFVQCDLKFSDNSRIKTKNFLFCPVKKVSFSDKFSDHMIEM